MAETETRTENPHCGESEERKKRRRLKKLQSEVREQIEFYFGDSNLRKDRFLKQQIEKTEEGYIHISTIATFNLIRKLTTDEALIARALQKSELLEVSQDKTQIRRKKPLEEPKYSIDDVTVYVENLPHNVDHDMLKKAFSPCGTIAYISLPRYRTTGDPKRFAFIEFTNPDDAAKACKLLNNPPKSNPRPDGHFPTTRKGRLILPENYAKPKQLPARHSDKHTKENLGKRKREDSENSEATSNLAKEESPRKKKAGVKSEREDKVFSKDKGVSEKVVEDRDEKGRLNTAKKVKKRKEKHHDVKTKNAHHLETTDEDRKNENVHSRYKDNKSSRKRKHSGEDTVKEKHTHSDKSHESKSHRGEKHSTDAKEEKLKKDGDSSETRKRKRDDQGQNIVGSKVKVSSSHKDKDDDVPEVKKRCVESNAEQDKKKKRSRSRKNKKEEGPPAPMMQLTVISKKEWLELKKEYLAIQKASRQQLKQTLRETQEKHNPTHACNQRQQKSQPQVSEAKQTSSEPEFVPGVVLKISSDKEFTSRKQLRERLEEIAPVAYIDLKDGDNSGFIRLKSADGAKAVLGTANSLTLENGQVDVEMLSGSEEQQYWDKLRADRESKLNCKKRKPRKRGVNRIMDRSEKILGNKKKFFDDEED